MYELTDKLAYFLCNRKPDHINGQHFIIPEISDLIIGDLSKEAKRKLQKVIYIYELNIEYIKRANLYFIIFYLAAKPSF